MAWADMCMQTQWLTQGDKFNIVTLEILFGFAFEGSSTHFFNSVDNMCRVVATVCDCSMLRKGGVLVLFN